jgi:predicted ATPase
MQASHCLVFDAFRLDLYDERLWRGREVIHLHPKTFAVLCCLVTQAGQLVTKDTLLVAVWPETVVSESVVTVAIRQLRRVLGDRARTPRFLAYVVRRRDPAHLLILGTYRPVDVIVHTHPLRPLLAELRQHPQCAELVLDYLSETAVTAYQRQRFAPTLIPPGLPRLLHQRTSGNALFLVTLVDELVRQQTLEGGPEAWDIRGGLEAVTGVIPVGLRQFIEAHVERLPSPDQVLLEAASVAGSTFCVAAVAAGVSLSEEAIDARCAAWARHGQFLDATGTETWPDGTVAACYRFRHTLYHEVVYARVAAGRRLRLHHQIGARKETGYGDQALTIAAELAVHFERAQEADRAVHFVAMPPTMPCSAPPMRTSSGTVQKD